MKTRKSLFHLFSLMIALGIILSACGAPAATEAVPTTIPPTIPPTVTPIPAEVFSNPTQTPAFTATVPPFSNFSANTVTADGVRGSTFYSLPENIASTNCPSTGLIQNLLINFTGGQMYLEKVDLGGRYIDSTSGEFYPIEANSNHLFQFERNGGQDYMILTQVEIQDCEDGLWLVDNSEYYAPWGIQELNLENVLWTPDMTPYVSDTTYCFNLPDSNTYLSVWINPGSLSGFASMHASPMSEGGTAYYQYVAWPGTDQETYTTGSVEIGQSLAIPTGNGPITISVCFDGRLMVDQ